jgi:hypothetical protein
MGEWPVMGELIQDTAKVTADLAVRIRGIARQRRRDRLVLELACIEWELSHFDADSRATIEHRLAEAFEAPAFSRLLEDSVRGHAGGHDWVRLFKSLGL